MNGFSFSLALLSIGAFLHSAALLIHYGSTGSSTAFFCGGCVAAFLIIVRPEPKAIVRPEPKAVEQPEEHG